MKTLFELLADPNARTAAIAEGLKLVEAEVEKKKGLTGIALKAGYGLVKAFKPGFLNDAVGILLNDVAPKLQPLLDEAGRAGRQLVDALPAKRAAVAELLLSVTDGRMAKSPHATIKAAYEKLRGAAKGHVEEAVPGLAAMLQRILS